MSALGLTGIFFSLAIWSQYAAWRGSKHLWVLVLNRVVYWISIFDLFAFLFADYGYVLKACVATQLYLVHTYDPAHPFGSTKE